MSLLLKGEKGSATIVVLGAMLVLSVLGIALLNISLAETIIVNNIADTTQAYYLAEAGIEKAIYNIKKDFEWKPDNGFEEVDLGDGKKGSFKIELKKDSNRFIIISKGFVSKAVKSITAVLERPFSLLGTDRGQKTPFPFAFLYVNGTPDINNEVIVIGGGEEIEPKYFPNLELIYNHLMGLSSFQNEKKIITGFKEGNYHYSMDVEIDNGGRFKGIIVSNGDINIKNGGQYAGIIYAKGDIKLHNGSIIIDESLVIAEGDVQVDNSATGLFIIAGGTITIKDSVDIDGGIISYNAPKFHNKVRLNNKYPEPGGIISQFISDSLQLISWREN